ncbi:jg17128 [Pararge aegeria aegeria]|uniref:Jg17128 protein n=1 Tax=Pararge aegeria aegeria TaxID=348720 RepID=A0A8S4SDV0_9NEOP|nr:jg17128 [Pararge aegeria aegeria]
MFAKRRFLVFRKYSRSSTDGAEDYPKMAPNQQLIGCLIRFRTPEDQRPTDRPTDRQIACKTLGKQSIKYTTRLDTRFSPPATLE